MTPWPDAYLPVIMALGRSLTPTAIERWMQTENHHLNDKRPIELLEARRYETVLEAARQVNV
jgi:hypothetical protein